MVPLRARSSGAEIGRDDARSRRELGSDATFSAIVHAMRAANWMTIVPGVLVVSIALSPIALGTAYPHWDAFCYYAPAQTLVADFARHGDLIGWNPWLSGGRPDNADPQAGTFSPLNIGIGLLAGGGLPGFTFFWWFVWCLGALGMARLSRHFEAPNWAAAILTTAFVSSGYYVGHAQHTSVVLGYSMLPWMLWRLDVALQAAADRPGEWRRPLLGAAQCGAIWGLYGLSSHPAMVAANSTLIALWTFARVITTRGAFRDRMRTAVVVGAVVLGVGLPILAPPYVLYLTVGSEVTSRHAVDRWTSVASTAFLSAGLASFASPELTSLGVRHPGHLGTDNSVLTVHLSLAVVALGLVAIPLAPRDRWRWALLAMALAMLSMALGRELPVRGWLYDHFLPFRFFRHAGIFRGHVMFLLILLALEAMRDLDGPFSARKSGRGVRNAGWTSAGVAILTTGLAILSILRASNAVDEYGAHINRAVMVVFGAGVCATTIFALMQIVSSTRRTVLGWALAAIVTGEAIHAVVVSRPQMLGDHPEFHSAWGIVARDRDPDPTVDESMLDRIFAPIVTEWPTNLNTATKRPTFKNYDPFTGPIYEKWATSSPLAAPILGRDRFWFATRAGALSQDLTSLDRLEQEFERRGAPIIVRHSEDLRKSDDAALAALPDARRVTLEEVAYRADSLEFVVEVPQAGWLWVTERFAPGWRATVDGEAVEVERANFLFRGLPISVGRHRVELTYSPRGTSILVSTSWLMLASIVAISVRDGRRRSPGSDDFATPVR